MTAAGIAALVFTVVLLVTTGYVIRGGLPLQIFQHDTPVDQRFIRRFFDIYYKAAVFAAVGASFSYALWGRFYFAMGAAALALLALAMRRRVIPAMEQLGAEIQQRNDTAVQAFRRVHSAALGVNLLQLVALVWGLTKVSL